MSASSRAHVEDLLRRIDELTQGLDKIKDPAARGAAQKLLEAVLDLHGLALAKISASLAADENGRALYDALGRDEQVKAVFLLYGLHPESARERVRDVVAALEHKLGVEIRLLSVGDSVARVAIQPGHGDWDALCHEVGGAIIDAAPDLDDVAIDRLAEPAAEATPDRNFAAAAG
ncbi:MAG TPA: hypothetical protein VHW02_07465 [Rhizomicrobium sp.]|jgi:hypothetical protein|nr:hypothetical protein [Rhizomicrobium sp.]